MQKWVIAFLLCIFVLRLHLYLFNYPNLNSLDPSLEYLVSSHIVTYHEFPWVGPTGANGTLNLNSPLYYYSLALLLLVYKSIFTLNFFNILAQSVMGLAIYLIIKRLFSPQSALLSLFFVSFSFWGMKSSQYFFQPFLSQAIFFISLYALLKKRVIPSILLYVVSISFYLSPVLYLPLYCYGIFLATRRYTRVLIISVLGILVSFGGVLLTQRVSPAFEVPNDYIHRFSHLLKLFEYLVFPSANIGREFFFFGLLLLGLPLLKRWPVRIILAGILIPLLTLPAFTDAKEHYLHLTVLFTLVYISVVIGQTFFVKKRWRLVGIMVSAALLYSSSNGFRFTIQNHYQTALAATDAIVRTIPDSSFEFIRFSAFESNNQPDWLFWHLLEEKTNKKYVSINPSKGIPIVPNNTGWVFLTCTQNAPLCTSLFTQKQDYVSHRVVFDESPFTTVLLKRADTMEEYAALGDIRFQDQNFPAAEEAYRKALPLASFGLGNALIKQNRLDEAKEIFENIQSYEGLGRIAYLTGNYKTAEQMFLRGKSYFDLGKLYRIMRRHDESEKAFTKALTMNPTDTGMLFGLGYLYMQYREFDKSEKAFLRAIALAPLQDNLYSGLGDLYLRMKRYEQSETMFQKALQINPNSDLFIGLGELYTETGRYEEAEKILKKGLVVNPKPDRYLGLGNFYLRVQRYEEAIRMFEKTIEMNPQSNGYIGLGNVYVQQNKMNEAEVAFKLCMNTPYKAQAWLALGNLYMNTMRYQEAEKMLVQAATDEEVKPQALESLENLDKMLYDKTTL